MGHRRRRGCCCTPAASSSSRRAPRTCWPRSTSAWPPASSASPGCGVSTITGPGQRPGRARARPQVRPAARQPRHPQPRAPRPHRRRVGLRRRRDPRRRHHRPGDHRGDPPRRDQGAAVDLLQPGGVGARHTADGRGVRPARVLRRHRLLPVRVGVATPTSCCPGRCTRRTRAPSTTGEGRIVKINQAVDPPGEARKDWQILVRPRPPPRQGPLLPVHRHRADLRGAAPRVGRRHRRLPRRHVAAHRGRDGPVLARARGGPSRARRGCSRAAASSTPTARPASTPSRSARPPRSSTTSTRSGSPRAAWSASTCRGTQTRRIGRPRRRSTPSRCARSTRASPTSLGVADGDLVRVDVAPGHR